MILLVGEGLRFYPITGLQVDTIFRTIQMTGVERVARHVRRHPLLPLHRKGPAGVPRATAGGHSAAAPITAAPAGNPRERKRSDIRLMEYADACSHPVQPCSTIVLFVSVRQDVHQLIGLRALLGALRSCR